MPMMTLKIRLKYALFVGLCLRAAKCWARTVYITQSMLKVMFKAMFILNDVL